MNPALGKNWRAGFSVIAALLLAVIAPYRAAGQARPGDSPSNIECAEYLEMPDYPAVARQARIQAVQTVKVLLSEEATVQTVESILENNSRTLEVTTKFFTASAEKAVRSSRFAKACGGKTVTLVFHYELRAGDTPSIFAFEPPNQFWIRAGPFLAMPTVSAK